MLSPPWTPSIIQFIPVFRQNCIVEYSTTCQTQLRLSQEITQVSLKRRINAKISRIPPALGGGVIFKIRHLAGFSFFFVLFPRNLFIFPKNHLFSPILRLKLFLKQQLSFGFSKRGEMIFQKKYTPLISNLFNLLYSLFCRTDPLS